MNIRRFSERLNQVDSESGSHIDKVKLCSIEGVVWETWERPFKPAEEFEREVTVVLDTLKEEFPKRAVQVLLVAEGQGVQICQQPITVWGVNKGAASGLLANDGSRSVAEGVDIIVKTAERLLGAATAQNATLQKTIELQGNQIHEFIEYIHEEKMNRALQAEQSSAMTAALLEMAKENMPMVGQLLQLLVAKKTATGPTGVVKSITEAAKVSNEGK